MYEAFLSTFLEIYDTNFPWKQVTVKPKDVKNPCKIIYSEAITVCEIFKTENDLQRLRKTI